MGNLVIGALAMSWVLNIVQLSTEYYEVGMASVKAVGIIVVPLGSVMGIVGLFV